jgi:hypothetical protein
MVYLPRHRARAEYSLAKLREVGFASIVLTEGVDAYTADVRQIAATEGWSFRPDVKPGEAGYSLAMFRLGQAAAPRSHP